MLDVNLLNLNVRVITDGCESKAAHGEAAGESEARAGRDADGSVITENNGPLSFLERRRHRRQLF